MPRRPRIDFDGAHHHVFNRGANRQTIFLDDRDRIEFGRLLGEVHDRLGIEILAYCLMGNHYHLLVRCPEAALSIAMHRLGGLYTQWFNARHVRDGSLFRGRFGSVVIGDDDHLLTAFRYVHRNALAVKGVESVDGYRWSSHRTYLGARPRPDFLNVDTLLDRFGGDRRRLDRFVQSDRRDRSSPPSHLEIIGVVEMATMVASSSRDHDADSGDRSRARRVVLASLVDRVDLLGEESAASLRRELDDPTPRSLRRARKRVREDDSLRRIADLACDELGFGSVHRWAA